MFKAWSDSTLLLLLLLLFLLLLLLIIRFLKIQLELYNFRKGKSPGGTLGIPGWGCAAATLEPLTYTRASSAKFCYPILE